jgi:hypothetical protein
MALSSADIRGVFTKTLIDVYQERIKPTSFLRSFFNTITVPTKSFAIEVERTGEKVAIDVVRGSEGNRNTFSKSTEKMFEPPIFREYFDMTELDLYDRVLGSQGNAQMPLFTALLNSAADRLGMLQDKIERAKELQCANVLETGIVLTRFGGSVDYKRKTASILNEGPGQYFSDNIDPFKKFEAGCLFLRQVGKSGDGIFNAILGSQALADLLVNTKFTARQNYFNLNLDAVVAPGDTLKSQGFTFHGTITCGSYKVQLFAYPQFYDLKGGTDTSPTYTMTSYVNTKKVFMMPVNPRFQLVHCAVPKLIGQPGQMPAQGEYVIQEFLDERNAKHDLDIQSAPLAVPVAVDQIYTFQAVA